ncbi:hypothetical protein BHE74_00009169 [Ensete ventricosum]|nr:hypothetical protein BHE74_00009169 [Ensete ventricosum]
MDGGGLLSYIQGSPFRSVLPGGVRYRASPLPRTKRLLVFPCGNEETRRRLISSRGDEALPRLPVGERGAASSSSGERGVASSSSGERGVASSSSGRMRRCLVSSRGNEAMPRLLSRERGGRLKAAKWSERRDAVAELAKLASTKRIAPGDFSEICRTLKKVFLLCL